MIGFRKTLSAMRNPSFFFFEITYIHLIQQGGKINYLTAKSLFLGWNESPFVITLTTFSPLLTCHSYHRFDADCR